MQIGTDDPIDQCLCRIEDRNFPNQELLDALKLLRQVLDNIIEHPDDEKYRRLNKTNAKLQEKLFKFDGVSFFLQAIGFKEEGDFYVYKPDDCSLFAVEKASKLLANRIRNFQIMVHVEEHPSYNLVKKRLDEAKELEEMKKKLLEEFERNRQEVWKEKNWDPTKYTNTQGTNVNQGGVH